MITVTLQSEPVLVFYRAGDAVPSGAAYPLLLSVSERRIALDAEAPSVTVTLDNRRGETSQILGHPPLRAEVQIVRAGVLWFRGALAAVELAEQARLTVIG